MNVVDKLAILSSAAKYDASCSTSGSARKAVPGQMGNAEACGICHSWAADGRCVSMLKVLLSNACMYDCAYCVNRKSNDTKRASFENEELIKIIMDFYRRNYIEGAFLSSGVIGCPDSTMERFIYIAKMLRKREMWNGYLHIKAIPGASPDLLNEAAIYADRLSVNIEMPSAHSLSIVAPDKKPSAIFSVMRTLSRASGFEPRKLCLPNQKQNQISEKPFKELSSDNIAHSLPEPLENNSTETSNCPSSTNYFLDKKSVMLARRNRYRNPEAAVLPAGQTTQLVIGASPESDATILTLAENLYLAYDVRRVYYSAYIPPKNSIMDPRVPAIPSPPLLREHRLYQADWLFRFYGFRSEEIIDRDNPFLDNDLDPKCSWAIRHPDYFPVEINKADYLELLRVPGIGPKSATRIVASRRQKHLNADNLRKMGIVMKRAAFFITCDGKAPVIPEIGKAVDASSPFAHRVLVDNAKGKIKAYVREFDFDE